MELSRRDAVKLGVLGSAALLLPIERVARTKTAGGLEEKVLPSLKFKADLPSWAPMSPTAVLPNTDFYEITMRQAEVDILTVPGGKVYPKTKIWGYNGMTPGPLIRVKKGRYSIVRQINGLEDIKHPTLRYEPHTSVHLHGSCSLPEYDGYASDVTEPGQFKDYHYPNIQDARTLWYHDHGIHQTAPNAYMGLAAQYHIYDDNELSLGIPVGGRYDVPLTIRDAIFNAKGQLVYDDNSESSLMGDVILVNGKPWPKMKVEQRRYRFRILNGAVSRSFKLALSTGDPMTVIATDGGLMPAPQPVASFRHSMGERYEVIIDFSKYKVGQRVILKNLGLPNNVAYDSVKDIMAFDVVGPATSQAGNAEPPPVLNPNMDVMGLPSGPTTPGRTFDLVRKNGMWTVNGTTWIDVLDADYGAPLASPAPGATEVWEVRNTSGGWFHPFHIHLVDFRIIERNGKPPFAYELGPKDTVYVGEYETVRLAVSMRGPDGATNPEAQHCYDEYGPRTGRYMMHCHNLIHEDHDMMSQFWVGGPPPHPVPRGKESDWDDAHHPIEAAKPRSWNESLSGMPDLDNFTGY